jgi:DNA-binding NarL/FixJ family response regulator
MEAIRVLIADDHLFYREGVRALLATSPDIAVVGEAGTGDEAVARALELAVDVVLMDLKMPGVNGIEATRRLIAARPQIAILVITMFDDDESVFAVMRAGARGYLLKDADQGELIRAIKGVHHGEAIFGPAIAQRMMQYFSGLSHGAGVAGRADPFPDLTEREREILALIAQGHPNQMIAQRLVLSVKTVQNHVSNIFGKLRVASRAEAIVRARDAGLEPTSRERDAK